MSEEELSNDRSTEPVANEELDTTPPNPVPAPGQKLGWEMPKPVFRQTSGYLPQGFEKKFPQPEVKADGAGAAAGAAPAAEVTAPAAESTPAQPPEVAAVPQAAAVPLGDIEPQPDISEHFDLDELIEQPTAPVVPKKRGAMRVVFIILGLLFAFALIAAFIVVVYFLFLSPAATNGTF